MSKNHKAFQFRACDVWCSGCSVISSWFSIPKGKTNNSLLGMVLAPLIFIYWVVIACCFVSWSFLTFLPMVIYVVVVEYPASVVTKYNNAQVNTRQDKT